MNKDDEHHYLLPGEALNLVRKDLIKEKVKRLCFYSFIMFLSISSGVITNLSYVGMIKRMNEYKYTVFYLYFTQIIYSFIYGMVVFIRSRDKLKLYYWKWYLSMGLLVGIGRIMIQLSKPYIDKNIQTLFTFIVLPVTAIGNHLFLKRKQSIIKIIAITIVLLGQVFIVIPSIVKNSTQTSLIASIVFAIGILLNGSTIDVIQQKVFSYPYEIDLCVQLFFISITSTLLSLFTFFLPMVSFLNNENLEQVFATQKDSWKCFLQIEPLPDDCERFVGVWMLVFIVSSTIYYYMQCYLIKMEDSVFQRVILSIISPISCFMFLIPFFGDEMVNVYVFISFIMIIVGILLFKGSK